MPPGTPVVRARGSDEKSEWQVCLERPEGVSRRGSRDLIAAGRGSASTASTARGKRSMSGERIPPRPYLHALTLSLPVGREEDPSSPAHALPPSPLVHLLAFPASTLEEGLELQWQEHLLKEKPGSEDQRGGRARDLP